MGLVEEIVMNANDFLMSLIVVGLAVGGYGQELRAEPPTEIATEQPAPALGRATEEMREAEKSAGELMDDTVITTKVKAALLQDPGTSGLQIGVETLIGGVQLSGSVDSVDEKQRAKEIAERVDGVIAVDNALSVK
jgi:hyperosmotically inducible periplasmic protein